MPITLAASDLFNQILPWLGGLVVVAVIGGFIMSAARRLLTSEAKDSGSAGFTLHDLRRLMESGEISVAEFERAKLNFMNSARLAADKQRQAKADTAAKGGGETPHH